MAEDERHLSPRDREVPPRRDRHVANGVLIETVPEDDPRQLPAPPDVAVWVAGDIADDVKMYAQRREAERRNLFPTFQRGGVH